MKSLIFPIVLVGLTVSNMSVFSSLHQSVLRRRIVASPLYLADFYRERRRFDPASTTEPECCAVMVAPFFRSRYAGSVTSALRDLHQPTHYQIT